MLVATFGPTTGWVGKKITREGDAFVLEGHGAISAANVMEYDREGYLVWANDGTRAWVGAKAQGSQVPRATVPVIGAAPSHASVAPPGAPTAAGSRLSSRRSTLWTRLLLLAIAMLAVANVVLILAIAGVFNTNHTEEPPPPPATAQSQPAVAQSTITASPAASWPTMFAGTWMHASGSQQEKAVIAEGGAQATLTWTYANGSTISRAFAGDTLTITASNLDGPTVLTRQAPSSDPYAGTYVWVTSAGTTTETVSFSGKTLSMTHTDAPSGHPATMTVTMAADGGSFSVYESLTGLTTVWVRQ